MTTISRARGAPLRSPFFVGNVQDDVPLSLSLFSLCLSFSSLFFSSASLALVMQVRRALSLYVCLSVCLSLSLSLCLPPSLSPPPSLSLIPSFSCPALLATRIGSRWISGATEPPHGTNGLRGGSDHNDNNNNNNNNTNNNSINNNNNNNNKWKKKKKNNDSSTTTPLPDSQC